MLISHEAPKNIMNLVQEYTDYDYCLVHLMQESNEYRNFFFDAKKKKRKIILDCSLYELGHAYDINKYIAWINILDPSEYIVPDVFQNFEANIQSFEKFMSIHNPFKVTGKTIGVVQGKTYKEMKEYIVKILTQEYSDMHWSDNEAHRGVKKIVRMIERANPHLINEGDIRISYIGDIKTFSLKDKREKNKSNRC